MSKVANAPYSPIITCSICKNEQTVARSANSYTLQLWHVINYPSDCHCPKCSSIKKNTATAARSRTATKTPKIGLHAKPLNFV